jgi:hypothetical protein
MRTRTSWLALLLTAGLAPAAARGQDYTPPDPVIPLPLWHDHPEQGGFYTAGEFVFMRQTNPLAHQVLAIRGILDNDGTITADLNGILVEPTNGNPPFILPGARRPGTFIGSQTPALFADDAGHNDHSFEPGFTVTGGWKFHNGVAAEITWLHLAQTKYGASATLAPPGLNFGQNLEETFLFSPVFNFPNQFAGPARKVALGGPFAAYGIWNGASVETVQFTQRFEQLDLSGRIPVCQDDCQRTYGLCGVRFVWMWERFKWRVVAEDFTGNAGQDDVALYNNIVSNRFYGVDAGCGYERRLGDTPLGTFSFMIDARAAVLLDVVKERASYERADFAIKTQRARNEYTIAPEVEGWANIVWYPIEGVEIRVGYQAMAFWNTVASPQPVTFNYGFQDVQFEKNHYRLFHGFNAGISFVF